MAARDESVRTCVGCRQRDDRAALLRFVIAGEPPQVVPDVSRRAAGRGASVHPRRRCIEAAVRSGALCRTLRAKGPVDADSLARWAHGQYERRLDALLSSALRAGKATYGSDRVREAIDARRAALLVVAGDALESRDALLRAADRLGTSCVVHGDKASLGRLFGRETVSVAAVTDRALAGELQSAARCAAEISEGA